MMKTISSTNYFVIFSPDTLHDHNSTYELQGHIREHIKSINCHIDSIRELTDGCVTQYKSRNCFGDFTYEQDFGYQIIRNLFGSHSFNMQNIHLYDFCTQNLWSPRDISLRCKRRICRYLAEIPPNRNRSFKALVVVRCFHQVKSAGPCRPQTRNLTCYNSCPPLYDWNIADTA